MDKKKQNMGQVGNEKNAGGGKTDQPTRYGQGSSPVKENTSRLTDEEDDIDTDDFDEDNAGNIQSNPNRGR